ncbi:MULTISPECIES: helix-turn-helix domain-containing protein [Actinomadura]|uniref:DNA binding domain-containing protein n=2 Tax=Actinomadura TaxID=1988 RepID=A0A7D3VZ70_ACTVE|nr:helix-turn-helix domain-containing protein [Actinomadura verrucosospora]QKG27313.1 DNA binding domain-containing protein [Actinomadura verrucosospora]
MPDHLDVPASMRMFTVEEAMSLLKLGRNTIFEEIRARRLRSVKRGRSRRIPGSAIAEYIALLEHETEVAA